MRLSYSSISTYQNCPLAYKFRYIDRLPTKRTPQLSFGSSVHAALACFYDVPHPKPCSLEELLKYLADAWESEGYQDQSEEQTYFKHAEEILTTFYHRNIGDFQVPIALEHKFEIDLNVCTLTGIIDRVDKLPDGSYEIIDYKTNRKLPPKSKIESDLQLSIYHLACKEVWGITPEKLSLYFLILDEKISTKRTDNDVRKTKAIIRKVHEDISAQKFQARKNPLCPWCDFQAHCSYCKHDVRPAKRQEENKISAGRSLDASFEIEQAVNEFISIKEKLQEFDLRLSELQNIIHAHCERHNINSLNAQKGTILRNKRVVQSYNVNKLKEVLAPHGLWEQILTVNGSSLKKLIGSDTTEEELKESIRDTIENEDTGYALHVTSQQPTGNRDC